MSYPFFDKADVSHPNYNQMYLEQMKRDAEYGNMARAPLIEYDMTVGDAVSMLLNKQYAPEAVMARQIINQEKIEKHDKEQKTILERLDKVVMSNLLTDAQKMMQFGSLIDRFGIKESELTRYFNTLTEADSAMKQALLKTTREFKKEKKEKEKKEDVFYDAEAELDAEREKLAKEAAGEKIRYFDEETTVEESTDDGRLLIERQHERKGMPLYGKYFKRREETKPRSRPQTGFSATTFPDIKKEKPKERKGKGKGKK